MNKKQLIKELFTAPEHAIEAVNLIYTSDHSLGIKRKRKQKEFTYYYKNTPVTSSKTLNRIKDLAIPPAWDKVRIAIPENGHLQAVGRDAKNRKQYRYHPVWNSIRNQTKFYRMGTFAKVLPTVREKADKDITQKGWPKSKVLGLIVKLMEETHIRIGNEQYAKRNKTYGLSTLRSKHLNIFKNAIKFEFTGKKGKKHNVTLRNKKLMRLVLQSEELPGWELFQYYDEDGDKHTIDSTMVNTYLQEISKTTITAKDFRTWAGTLKVFEALYEMGITNNEKEIKQNMILALEQASKALGNTRNVCKKYYVHPFVISSYKDQSIANSFHKIDQIQDQPFFTASEQSLMHLLEQYKPEFLD